MQQAAAPFTRPIVFSLHLLCFIQVEYCSGFYHDPESDTHNRWFKHGVFYLFDVCVCGDPTHALNRCPVVDSHLLNFILVIRSFIFWTGLSRWGWSHDLKLSLYIQPPNHEQHCNFWILLNDKESFLILWHHYINYLNDLTGLVLP